MSDAQAIEMTITHQVQAHQIAGHRVVGQAVPTAEASVEEVRPATGNIHVNLRSDDT